MSAMELPAGVAPYDGAVETPLLLRFMELVRAEADPGFHFVSRAEVPFAPLAAPLSATRVALVGTAALHLASDPPFRALEERLGDPTLRAVPHAARREELALDAPYLDRKYLPQDLEVAFPRAALDALCRAGLVGPPPERHYSFCGGVLRPYPGLAQSAEVLARLMAEDGAGAAVLVPTCSICVQTMAVVACELESRGLPTVSLSLLPELSRIAGAPRTLALRFPFGAPLGDPSNAALQRAILAEALELLTAATAPRTLVSSRHAWRRSPLPGP